MRAIFFLVLTFCILPGCGSRVLPLASDDGTAAPPDTQATPRPTPIITRLEVAPREFTAGQTARIVVTARNTSTDTLRFTFSSACQLIYRDGTARQSGSRTTSPTRR